MNNYTLIYKDNKNNYTIPLLLSKHNYDFNTTYSEEYLIENAKNNKLVIMDLSTFNHKKLSILEKIISNDISIIIVADKISNENLKKLIKYKIKYYFDRPFNEKEFISTIKKSFSEIKLKNKNEQLVNKLKEKINKFQLLNKTSKMINSKLDINIILKKLMKNIGDIVDAEAWTLFSYNKETNKLIFKYVVGEKSEQLLGKSLNVDQGIVGWAASNKESILVKNVNKDSRFYKYFDKKTNFKTKSLICVPIIYRNELLGVVEVVNKKHGRSFTEEDLNIMEILVDNAAIAIKNSYLLEQIYQITLKDHLTDLYNFRKLNNIIDKNYKNKKPFALIFMDLDDFKKVNDNFGHNYGSKALIEFSEILKSIIDNNEYAFRYGGDEFIVILENRDLNLARDFAETILKKVKNHTFLKNDKLQVKLTLSIGISHYPLISKKKKEILTQADQAMYKVKKRKKDNYAIFGESIN